MTGKLRGGRGWEVYPFRVQVSMLLYALNAGIASDIVTGRALLNATVQIRRIIQTAVPVVTHQFLFSGIASQRSSGATTSRNAMRSGAAIHRQRLRGNSTSHCRQIEHYLWCRVQTTLR